MARILVIASFTPSLILFRGDMLRELTATGHEVVACSPDPDPETVSALTAMGVTHLPYRLQRTGLNPWRDFATYRQLRAIMAEIDPDHVLAYTIKPVIYGCLAAAAAGVPGVHAMITGLGTAFEKKGPSGRILGGAARFLYRRALARAATVFFQNPDDRDTFTGLGLVAANKAVLINGSGVHTERFSQRPVPTTPVVFLLIARLLREKGVREFAAAAALLQERGLDCRCRVVGFFDRHPQAIQQSEMDAWVAAGLLEFAGPLADVRPALAACTVYCLPSYREGLPRTVLEAMATGRAIITTDAPGCRETVIEGQNGFLVPVRDAPALAAAMASYVADPELAVSHGARSREIAVQTYDVKEVNRTIFRALNLG